jgi:HAD superfamily hydrolase (TIGR01509 family)
VPTKAALLDLDGTLVDANYHHALAWYRAFRARGIVLPVWRLHRHIGMGGDMYVRAVAGDEVEERLGGELRDEHSAQFQPIRDECEPLEGARDLVAALKERGLVVVLASSSGQDDLDFFLDKLDVRELVDGWTSKDDVERSKPHPEVVQAAIEKAGADAAVMLGDSRWDIESAASAGVETVAVITGGWSEQELRDHGAVAVYESLVDLRERLDETPFAAA